jgi:membrane associated rhomboid family serine protease
VVNARQSFGAPSFQATPVSFTIMAITAGIFVLGLLSPAADRWLFQTFAQANFLVAAGEWWRIFTAALLHGGMMHILFNMYALYLFGPRLEQQVGSPGFAALYVATAGTGGMVSYAFGATGQVSIGASGAIFGLLGAWMFVAWKMRHTPGGRSMFNQLGVLLAINLALPLFVGGIDWRAHLGGLAGGILIAWLWSVLAVGKPNARAVRTVTASAVAVAAVIITMII